MSRIKATAKRLANIASQQTKLSRPPIKAFRWEQKASEFSKTVRAKPKKFGYSHPPKGF